MPLPLVFCPDGALPPAWVAGGPIARTAAAGGGRCWHGPWRAGAWIATAAGWQVLLDGHQPQHLVRPQPHPRVAYSIAVQGTTDEQLWVVPVLLRPVLETDTARLFEPAIDRVWSAGDWQIPAEFEAIISGLLAVASDAPAGDESIALRNARLARLAISGLALTHLVDEDLIAAAGWLTESVQRRVIRAMSGLSPEPPTPAAVPPC